MQLYEGVGPRCRGILFVGLFSLMGLLFPQEDQEKIKEHVDVVQVELMVRALQKGEPVPGLQAEDFILLENGKRQPVTSVLEMKRRISSSQMDLQAVQEKTVKHRPRFFILYFWIYEVQLDIGKALDHFFADIYHAGDVVILASRDQYIQITSPDQISDQSRVFLENLEQAAKFIELETQSRFNKIDWQCRNIAGLIEEIQGTPLDDAVGQNVQVLSLEIQQKQIELRELINIEWRQFRLKYLDAQMAKLEALADGLGKVKMERWGLVFFQYPIFPTLDFRNQIVMETILGERWSIQWMTKFFQPVNNLQFDRIWNAFFSANATFHLLLLDSKTKDRYSSEYINVQYVASGSEELFRQITKATGGEIVVANKLYEGIKKVAESDDIYYVLTYSPSEKDQKNRKIKIRTRRRGIRVIHLNRLDMERIKSVKLADVVYEYPVLYFTIKDYRMMPQDGVLTGQVALGLRAVGGDDYNEFFSRYFQLTSEEVQGSMTLYLPEGEYRLTLDVVDKNAGTNDSLETAIRVKTPGES